MVLADFVCVVSLAVSVCYKGKAFIVIKGLSFTQLASRTLGAGMNRDFCEVMFGVVGYGHTVLSCSSGSTAVPTAGLMNAV